MKVLDTMGYDLLSPQGQADYLTKRINHLHRIKNIQSVAKNLGIDIPRTTKKGNARLITRIILKEIGGKKETGSSSFGVKRESVNKVINGEKFPVRNFMTLGQAKETLSRFRPEQYINDAYFDQLFKEVGSNYAESRRAIIRLAQGAEYDARRPKKEVLNQGGRFLNLLTAVKSLNREPRSAESIIKAIRRRELMRSGNPITRDEANSLIDKWWDSLGSDGQKKHEDIWSRRKAAVDSRIIKHLRKRNVDEVDIRKLLKGRIEYHHFDEVLNGTMSLSKFDSGMHMDNALHKVLHDVPLERYGGISASDRLQRLLKHKGEKFGPVENYNPTRKGVVPLWVRKIAQRSFGDKESARMIAEMQGIHFGEDSPDVSSTRNINKSIPVSEANKKLLKGVGRVGKRVLGPLGVAFALDAAQNYWTEGKPVRASLAAASALPVVGWPATAGEGLINAAEWAYKQPTVYSEDPYSGMGTQQGILGEGHPGFQDRRRKWY